MTQSSISVTKFSWISGGAIFFLSLISLQSFVIVPAGERGVLMNFGKVQDRVLDEGIHFKLPLVTSVTTLTVRIQRTDIESTAGTKDLQTLNASLALNWHIDPGQANKVFQRVGNEAQIVNQIIKPPITEVLKDTTRRLCA